MSWVKDREEFKQAALSTARALSKNSTLESTTQASSRPPSSSQISLNYPPRSSKQVNSWRGEADFQTFWHTFHNDDASLKIPKIARDFFLELELSRVEIIGGETFPGAKINLNAYLNTQAKIGIDNKVPALNPLAANLWLKQINGEILPEDSQNTVKSFLASLPVNIEELGKKEKFIVSTKWLDKNGQLQKAHIKWLKETMDFTPEKVDMSTIPQPKYQEDLA